MRSSRRATQLRTINDVTTHVGQKLGGARRALAAPLAELVPVGTMLEGPLGFDAAVEITDFLEREFQSHLWHRKGFPLFAGLRQLSQRLWSHMGEHAAMFFPSSRNVAELAVHRYAEWTPMDFRQPMPVWTPQTIGPLVRLFILAEVYSGALAARRRLGKGEIVQITGEPGNWFSNPDPESAASRLVHSRDERQFNDPNVFSGYAALASDAQLGPQSDRILAAEWVAPSEVRSMYEDFEQAPPDLRGALSDMFERLVHLGHLENLDETRSTLAVYDEALKAREGFGLLDVECALDIASSKVVAAWEELTTLELHGFALAPRPSREDIALALQASRSSGLNDWEDVTVDRVQLALRFLDSDHEVAALANPVACRPIRTVGTTMLYDAVHVRMPNALLWDVPLTPALQQQYAFEFEESVHRLLCDLGDQPWPRGKELRSGGKIITDVDASVVVGTALVAVDCYSPPWNPSLDQGSHAENRNRADKLARKYRSWSEKWGRIVEHHSELLPDGVTQVFPVVVTSGAEWISSLDDDLWFDAGVPRMCTPHELVALITSPTWPNSPGFIT